MNNTPENLSDRIDERIEYRLPQLQDSLELKLKKEFDSLFKDRFESIVKLLGWAFGLVAFALAGLGVKTIFDVRDVARTAAIEEVKKKLAIDDPNSEFRRDVDKVIARGLINSYFLVLNRNKGERFSQDIRIAEVDLKRLLDLVNDPRSSEKDFTDACEVMFRSRQLREDQALSRNLIALGAASGEGYRWMRDQPEKRAVLFQFEKTDKLIPSAREIIADAPKDKALTVAAMRYLAENLDKDSSKQIEKLAASSDAEIADSALHSLASIAPDSEALNSTLFPAQNSKDEAIANSVRLAITLAKKPSSRDLFDDDPLEEFRLDTASRVIQNAIDKEYVFCLSTSFSHRGGSSLSISKRKDVRFKSYGLSSELLLGLQVEVFDSLLKKAAKDDTQLAKALRALCLEDDGQCWGVVRVYLDDGGKLVLASGVALDKAAAPAGITLRPASPKADAEILVVWTDSTASSNTSNLSKILEPEKVRFQVATVRTIASKEESDE